MMPDVVLIRKVPTERRARRRTWKLRSLIKEEEDGAYVSMHKGAAGHGVTDDYEEFLADTETDAAARGHVDLYKDPSMWRIAEDGSVVPGRATAEEAEEVEAGEAGAAGEEEAIVPQALLDGLVLGEEDEEEPVGRALGDFDDEEGRGAPQLAIRGGDSSSQPLLADAPTR